MSLKSKIVIIFPYKFSVNNHLRYEIDMYEKYCDVTILEIAPIAAPEYESIPPKEKLYKGENIKYLKTFKELISELSKFDDSVLIINPIPAFDGFRELIVNFLITRSKSRVISIMNPGLHINTLHKRNFFKSFLGLMLRKLYYFFNAPDYFFVAGSEFYNKSKKYLPSKTKNLFGHSYDYSFVLSKKHIDKPDLDFNYAVLIDE